MSIAQRGIIWGGTKMSQSRISVASFLDVTGYNVISIIIASIQTNQNHEKAEEVTHFLTDICWLRVLYR